MASSSSIGSLLLDSGTTPYCLAIPYLLSLLFALRRLQLLLRAGRVAGRTGCTASILHPPTLLILLVVTALVARTISFIAISAITLSSSFGTAPPPTSPDQLSRVLAVVFNSGDWLVSSIYLLLVVVWVSALQHAHKTHNELRVTRDWFAAYLTLSSLFLFLQISLYTAILLPLVSSDTAHTILSAMYLVLGCLNLAMPLLFAATVLSYSLQLAGYPAASVGARADWRRLTRLLGLWTVSRFAWAAASLLAAAPVWSNNPDVKSKGEFVFTMVAVALFFAGELVPLLACLGTDVLSIFAPLEKMRAIALAQAEGRWERMGVEEWEDAAAANVALLSEQRAGGGALPASPPELEEEEEEGGVPPARPPAASTMPPAPPQRGEEETEPGDGWLVRLLPRTASALL